MAILANSIQYLQNLSLQTIDCLVPEKYPEDTNTVGSTFKETNESNSGWEAKLIQCPQSKEEDSVATICGFGDKFHDLRVQTQ